MHSTIKLTITNGPFAGTKYELNEHINCIIGRDKDCTIRIPGKTDEMISRNHCILDINPPDIAIQDLNSRNGTFINDVKLPYSPEGEFKWLKKGDVIQVGNTVIAIDIESVNKKDETEKRCTKCGANLDTQGQCRHCGGALTLIQESDKNIIKNNITNKTFSIEGYKIAKLIAEGGNGAVYLAEKEDTGEKVAVKVILPRIANSQEAIDSFLREADTTASLKHKNIIEIKEVSYTGEAFYFSMEYCEKGNLWEYINNIPKINIKESIEITYQILDGLDHAHNARISNILDGGILQEANGLVHRDIKPENIFLKNKSGKTVAKIADFGLSKAFDHAGLSGFTMTGTSYGSPVYMCKEHLRNYKYAKPEVDVWSTAGILYFMLTKDHPRETRYDKNHIKMILESDPIPIKKRNMGVPKQLAELIDFALEDKEELNFKTAGELKKALQIIAKSLDL